MDRYTYITQSLLRGNCIGEPQISFLSLNTTCARALKGSQTCNSKGA